MIQLPAGATVAMPGQGRDFGFGWWPGGIPGIQTRHSPGSGRWPGGTPSLAAVLGPRFDSTPRASALGGGGSKRIVRVVGWVQAPALMRPASTAADAPLLQGHPPDTADPM